MTDWPPIDDARMLDRFAMDDEEFAVLARRLASRIGRREFDDQHLQRALSYPWSSDRPEGGYLLAADEVTPVSDVDPAVLSAAASHSDRFGGRRHALLAIGSNAAPEVLAEKLATIDDASAAEREVLVLDVTLEDLAIGFSPHLAVYGALPSTPFVAPGARCNAAVLMVTPRQLHALTRSEFNYLLGSIGADRADMSVQLRRGSRLLAFVSRHGVLSDTHGQALRVDETGQQDALSIAAGAVLGEGATAEDLVRRTIESYEWAVDHAKPRLAQVSAPLNRDDLLLHPGERLR